MLKSNHKYAIISLITANIIWGASSPIFKWTLTNVPPFTLAFFRFFVASLCLLPFTYKRIKIKSQDFFSITLLGLLMFLNISLYFFGLTYTSSINAPIIASSGPIILILFSVCFLHEQPKYKVFLGTLLSLLGVLIITLRPVLEHTTDGIETLGNIFFLLATVFAALHAILAKKLLAKYRPLTITWWYFFLSGIGFLIFSLPEQIRVNLFATIDIRGIIGISFGTILASILAHLLYIWGINKIAISEIGVFSYIDPIAAIIVAIPLLGEKITLPFVIGSLLVFLGIYTAEGRFPWHPIHKLWQ